MDALITDAQNEIWKDISGFEGYYKISNYGKVFSVRKNRLLTPHKTYRGYLLIWLAKNKGQYHYSVHRLVAFHFLPPPFDRQEVDHKDQNKVNNYAGNLRWVSHSQNMQNRHPLEAHELAKKVIHLKTGKVYKSISEAARRHNTTMVNISMQLRGMRKNKLGFAYHVA